MVVNEDQKCMKMRTEKGKDNSEKVQRKDKISEPNLTCRYPNPSNTTYWKGETTFPSFSMNVLFSTRHNAT